MIAGTRAALGAGLGLLLADRLPEGPRRAVGWTLLLVGAVSTIPLAFEVFGSAKPIGATATPVLGQNLGAGAYVLSADVTVESATETEVTCNLGSGGEAKGFVEPGVPDTLSLSATRTFAAAGTESLTCSAPGGATANIVVVDAILTPKMREENPGKEFPTFTPTEHIADAIAWLCSDAAAEMNGARLALTMP